MKYSNLFGKTKRDAPADLGDDALQLSFRAGIARPSAEGAFLFLPLGARVLAKLEQHLVTELSRLGALELRGLARPDLSTLVAGEIQSYKQLPVSLWWRGNSLPRVHIAAIQTSVQTAHAAEGVLREVAARVFAAADIKARLAHDIADATIWYAASPVSELRVLECTNGDYAATRAAAVPFKPAVEPEEALPLEPVETPHCDTIEALARYMEVPISRTAKAVFYASDGQVIFAVIRGDLKIDEDKLKRALGVDKLRLAMDDEIQRVGAVPGYASPIGTRGARIIVDDSIVNSPNLIAGANREGYHLRNTNVPRDYQPDAVLDISQASPGDTCPHGDGELQLVRGIQLGHISSAHPLQANYLDANGKTQIPYAIELELDLGAVALAHIGAHHDAKGIVWSRALAPFDAYIVALNADKPEVASVLERLGETLRNNGIEFILDDRSESAGVKFHDADLIGLPLRITVGPKTVGQNAVEFKARSESAPRLVPLDSIAQELAAWVRAN